MFTLPLQRRVAQDANSLPDLSGLKVLIVDDMACIRTILRRLLQAVSVKQVTEVSTAEAGWREVCELKPDLLIADWQLGGESGLGLVREIRWSPLSPNPFMAVMMISSFAEEHRIRRAASEGATCYLAKPFSAGQFFSKLKQCVEDQRQFESSLDYFGPQRAAATAALAKSA
jgi:two-component system, chemotaxis family, chemotaxis protein CheY